MNKAELIKAMTDAKKKEKVTANFKIPAELRQAAETLAQKRGINLSKIIRQALDLYIHLDAHIWPAIEHMADAYGLPEQKIIRNIVLKYIGEFLAMDEVYGANDQRIVTEFSRTRKGDTLEGPELIAVAKKNHMALLNLLERVEKNILAENKAMEAKIADLSSKLGKS